MPIILLAKQNKFWGVLPPKLKDAMCWPSVPPTPSIGSKLDFFQIRNILIEGRVEKSREHGEHAPRTPKGFPWNTQGKKLSKGCLDSISGHMFCEYRLIYQYFPSSACSIALGCLIVQKHWVCIAQLMLPERLSTFFSSIEGSAGTDLKKWHIYIFTPMKEFPSKDIFFALTSPLKMTATALYGRAESRHL